ncbi:hypothetical protein MLD38_017402 [Melastoma candidum]|uniref:Uncharacterized protein n=1 Tax=Melastoma candidum TaxID=119954 RepID=A0ACB9QPP5_9MYRT|nr:hypothetical protein MLD38_017402 [Melastoma candidum]
MSLPILLIVIFSVFFPVTIRALGSASTYAVVSGTATVCGIVAGELTQSILCYQNRNGQSRTVPVLPNASFESLSGGYTFFCGLTSGGLSILCWDTAFNVSYSGFEPRRIYNSPRVGMTDLAVGDDQVCAREVSKGVARCWRGERGKSLFPSPGSDLEFSSITSGSGFSCGILANDSRVSCWGIVPVAGEIQKQFGNLTMSTLVAGVSHVCGLTAGSEFLVCKGKDEFDQLSAHPRYSGIAAGANFSCAIRGRSGQVVCWEGGHNRGSFEVGNESFETIVAGSNFVCGLVSSNLTVICWGPGWSNPGSNIPIGTIIPGPCVRSPCVACGTYPNSDNLCRGSGSICKPCQVDLPVALPLPPLTLPPVPRPVSPMNRLSQVFIVIGSVGAFAGICATLYCLCVGERFCRKSDGSVQLRETDSGVLDPADMPTQMSAPALVEGQSSISIRGKRTESWSKHTDIVEKFSLAELSAATRNFSLVCKIGSGSFGTVYRGLLTDGREVAIKRGRTGMVMKKYRDNENAFGSELAILSRLNHKHLVRLIGFCQEGNEWLLVYEYMSNGTLHGLLHNRETMGSSSGSDYIVDSWKMRIKIALDAARGIEYLHNYAVPPIIHRDIKSSNILLDADWTGRISDFGLSLTWPQSDKDYISGEAVGTVGYIDPEYYVMNTLTTKSDVYGFGVVLLQLLTGKRAVFKDEDGSGPQSLVEYAVPHILAGDLQSLLDRRIKPPATNEAGAVEAVARTAARCVSLEGRDRPDITEVVIDLERALPVLTSSV